MILQNSKRFAFRCLVSVRSSPKKKRQEGLNQVCPALCWPEVLVQNAADRNDQNDAKLKHFI